MLTLTRILATSEGLKPGNFWLVVKEELEEKTTNGQKVLYGAIINPRIVLNTKSLQELEVVNKFNIDESLYSHCLINTPLNPRELFYAVDENQPENSKILSVGFYAGSPAPIVDFNVEVSVTAKEYVEHLRKRNLNLQNPVKQKFDRVWLTRNQLVSKFEKNGLDN